MGLAALAGHGRRWSPRRCRKDAIARPRARATDRKSTELPFGRGADALKPSGSAKSAASPDTAHLRNSNRAHTDDRRCRTDEEQVPDYGLRSVSLSTERQPGTTDSSRPRLLGWNEASTASRTSAGCYLAIGMRNGLIAAGAAHAAPSTRRPETCFRHGAVRKAIVAVEPGFARKPCTLILM